MELPGGRGVDARSLTAVRDFHAGFAWVVVATNALAGVWASAAHWLPAARHRALWWFVAAAQATIVVEVALGAVLVSRDGLRAPEFHDFYGFVTLISAGILYSYRATSPWVRERQYVVYGLGSFFLMGLAIRAMQLG